LLEKAIDRSRKPPVTIDAKAAQVAFVRLLGCLSFIDGDCLAADKMSHGNLAALQKFQFVEFVFDIKSGPL